LRDNKIILHTFHAKVVEQYVRNIIAKQMKTGAKRKLWTVPILETYPQLAKDQAWRGPWKLYHKRVVKTGTYIEASGGGFDYWGEANDYYPPYLEDQKTHILYWLDREDGYRYEMNGSQTIFVEKKHTQDWQLERVAELLMEAK